ncbi:MAG: hypothetical protein AAF307_06960 [Pseudomonadota bacterium]
MADTHPSTHAGFLARIATSAKSAVIGAGEVLTYVFTMLAMTSTLNERARTAIKLHELSDAKLAEKGLKREDIARHVFGDIWYA